MDGQEPGLTHKALRRLQDHGIMPSGRQNREQRRNKNSERKPYHNGKQQEDTQMETAQVESTNRSNNNVPATSPVDKGLDAMVNSAQTLNEMKQDLRAVRESLTQSSLKADVRDCVKGIAILTGSLLIIEGIKVSANWLFAPKAEVAALPVAAVTKK